MQPSSQDEMDQLAELILTQIKATQELQELLDNWHLGSYSQHLSQALLLVERGADPNLASPLMSYALIAYAASVKDTYWLEELLELGANPDLTDCVGRTPLVKAALAGNLIALQILLEHNADPNISDNSGKTALDYAREYKDQKVMGMLKNKIP